MSLTDTQRADILEWASWRALEDAKAAGMSKPSDDNENIVEKLIYDRWIQEKIWHYEKLAYQKIQRRQGG